MRAVLLLLLGGCLLWFVWRSLDTDRSTTDETHAASPGTMLAPEPEPHSELADAQKTAEKAAENQVTTARGSGVGNTPAPLPDPKLEPRAERPISSSPANEMALAGDLVRAPTEFLAAVQENAGDLPTGRKQFALALGQLVTGADADARALVGALDDDASVSVVERQFLHRMLDHKTSGAEPAAASSESPLVAAAAMVLESREAESAARSGRHRDAALLYSALLLQDVNAGWRADAGVLGKWTQALRAEQGHHRWSKNGDWPAIPVTVEKGDNLTTVRKRVVQQHPELLVYTSLLERVNELGGSVIQPGQTLRVPTDKVHLLVDLDAHWAFFMMGEEVAAAWPVGVGKEGSETKVGRYVVGEKTKEPMWFPPGRAPVPFGDPQNPLGTRWIAWVTPGAAPGSGARLGFHGTKDPQSIGKDLSQGCIRMRNEDVEELFELVPKGAEIVVQP